MELEMNPAVSGKNKFIGNLNYLISDSVRAHIPGLEFMASRNFLMSPPRHGTLVGRWAFCFAHLSGWQMP